jgi:hypothetical protein
MTGKVIGPSLSEAIKLIDDGFEWVGYGSEQQEESWRCIKEYLSRDRGVSQEALKDSLIKLLAEAENRIETDAKLLEMLSSEKVVEISDIVRIVTPAKLDESVSCFSADIDDESYRLGWNSCVESILTNHSEV